jgi:RecJ-like exonuclease
MKKSNSENVGGMARFKVGKDGALYSTKTGKRLVTGEMKSVIKDFIKKTLKELGEKSMEEAAMVESICPTCNGSGEGHADGSTCQDCGGSGDSKEKWNKNSRYSDGEYDDSDNSGMDEASVSGGVSGPSTPYAFGKDRRDIATTSLPGHKVVGKSHGTLEEADNDKTPKIVPVGLETNPDVVKDPKHRGVNKNDLYILNRRKEIAAAKEDEKEVEHYEVLIRLAKKALKSKKI